MDMYGTRKILEYQKIHHLLMLEHSMIFPQVKPLSFPFHRIFFPIQQCDIWVGFQVHRKFSIGKSICLGKHMAQIVLLWTDSELICVTVIHKLTENVLLSILLYVFQNIMSRTINAKTKTFFKFFRLEHTRSRLNKWQNVLWNSRLWSFGHRYTELTYSDHYGYARSRGGFKEVPIVAERGEVIVEVEEFGAQNVFSVLLP